MGQRDQTPGKDHHGGYYVFQAGRGWCAVSPSYMEQRPELGFGGVPSEAVADLRRKDPAAPEFAGFTVCA